MQASQVQMAGTSKSAFSAPAQMPGWELQTRRLQAGSHEDKPWIRNRTIRVARF
jgi:hypothetical protein